jgi:archaemetzincin
VLPARGYFFVMCFRLIRLLFVLSLILTCLSCSGDNEPHEKSAETTIETLPSEQFAREMEAVMPFFSTMPAPGPEDWLASFNEPGQTFEEYLNSSPTVPTDERKTLYVLPLGKFSDAQFDAIKITSEYLQAFFGLQVVLLPNQTIDRPLRIKDSRISRYGGNEQIRTGHILDDVLRPLLKPDAAALIAFTNEDLFPDESMNYVFGQASLENRVGVWSLYRLQDGANRETFILRTIKIAAHETGHMFSMRHCRKYNCVMSGSNHLAETDSHPIDACPECMAKICWFSHVDPAERYRRLAEVCRSHGLIKDAKEFERKYSAMKELAAN